MRAADWAVLLASLFGVAFYGWWRGRGSKTTSQYLLADKTMPWYAMALSIMATQASAITFISTTGQAYADGMRFVQMYLGLPLALIVVAAFMVPRFHASGVYTAYEYLERRFDARVRALTSIVFLIQRGLAAGVALYAPSVVLTVLLGIPDTVTTALMGVLVVAYTVSGGIQAVTWTDFVQMLIMTVGLFTALLTAIWLLPADISFSHALDVAGAAGRLNPIVWQLDFSDRYNIWSGLLGGMFLALAYFGCDQSQVQRYLTGKNITHSRLSLLFNAAAKIPMQFFILFTGAIVFVFFTFVQPPVLFHPADMARLQGDPKFAPIERQFDAAWNDRQQAARDLPRRLPEFKASQVQLDAARAEARGLAGGGEDTNYIFLTFVTRYMPVGVVGLIMATIFAAAMSTVSAEVNSLATVTVMDVYRRFLKPGADDRHLLLASRWATAFWGIYAVIAAHFGRGLGSLVEAVNLLGSFFYPGLIGVFSLAFFFPRANARGAFYGVLIGEAAVFALKFTTSLSFLWFNFIGCAIVIAAGMAISLAGRHPRAA